MGNFDFAGDAAVGPRRLRPGGVVPVDRPALGLLLQPPGGRGAGRPPLRRARAARSRTATTSRRGSTTRRSRPRCRQRHHAEAEPDPQARQHRRPREPADPAATLRWRCCASCSTSSCGRRTTTPPHPQAVPTAGAVRPGARGQGRAAVAGGARPARGEVQGAGRGPRQGAGREGRAGCRQGRRDRRAEGADRGRPGGQDRSRRPRLLRGRRPATCSSTSCCTRPAGRWTRRATASTRSPACPTPRARASSTTCCGAPTVCRWRWSRPSAPPRVAGGRASSRPSSTPTAWSSSSAAGR